MYAILGGGFGLYGYLPALLRASDDSVVLPLRYRDTVERRQELRRYSDRIVWAGDDADVIARADGLVIARRPADQENLISRALTGGTVARLILEKPLCPTPGESREMLLRLMCSGTAFRIGYTFQHLTWAKALSDSIRSSDRSPVTIVWEFTAHHARNGIDTWKARHSEGGGALRFYGIQLIALLAGAGYDQATGGSLVFVTPDRATRWSAALTGPGLPPCTVTVDCEAATTRFAVASGAGTIFKQPTPFTNLRATGVLPGEDERVPLLTRVISSFSDDSGKIESWYASVNALWMQVEGSVGHD